VTARTIRFGTRRTGQIAFASRGGASVPAVASRDTATEGRWRIMLLVLALPMFAQCFQYMVDILPLYALSKAWPVLMLPLFGWALMRLDVPWKVLQIALLLWVLGVTPMVGIIQLGNGFFAALATSVKVWSYTYVFSAAGLLVALRPRPRELRQIILWLGTGTYIIMVLLYLVAPKSWYGGGDVETKLFMYDPERGYHLYMPMFFGTLLIFYLNRSFWMQRRLWKLAGIIVALALQFFIYKERASIAGAIVTLVFTTAWSTGKWRPAAMALLAVAAGFGVLALLQHAQHPAALSSNLGGSLAVRQVSIATAWKYVTADPFRWIVGSGATTRFGNITFAQLFGNRMFFLTDIGWLGVLFEYGLIGVLLLLGIHLAGLSMASGWARPGDPLSYALVDYIVYLLIVSAIYSVVFTPGEPTTVIALAYYFARMRKMDETGHGTLASQAPASNPRHIARANASPSGRLALPRPAGAASRG
jgi:hypothetical protein